jgi:hypothetical protein
LAKYLPSFGTFFKGFSGLVTGGALRAIVGTFGGIATAGTVGWMLGRLLGSQTGLDEKMQKFFTAMMSPTIHGAKAGRSALPEPGGLMRGWQLKAKVGEMRDTGMEEDVVRKYVMDNLKMVQEFRDADIEHRATMASGFVGWLKESGHARQRQIDYATPSAFAGGEAYERSKKASAMLEDTAANTAILVEIAKMGRVDFKEKEAKMESTEQSRQIEQMLQRQADLDRAGKQMLHGPGIYGPAYFPGLGGK